MINSSTQLVAIAFKIISGMPSANGGFSCYGHFYSVEQLTNSARTFYQNSKENCLFRNWTMNRENKVIMKQHLIIDHSSRLRLRGRLFSKNILQRKSIGIPFVCYHCRQNVYLLSWITEKYLTNDLSDMNIYK